MNSVNIIKLKSNNPNKYVVVKLPDGTMCVHDKESGENFFNRKSIAELTGLTVRSISLHLEQYKALPIKGRNPSINLNLFNSKRPVEFFPFGAVNYIAYRSNKPEAIQARDYTERALNEKFNRDVGFTKTIEPTREDKILHKARKQQAKIRMQTDALYTELNFTKPNAERTKEILDELSELKPEELRINRQIKNIENCFGSLSKETSARSQSKLLDFDNNSKKKLF